MQASHCARQFGYVSVCQYLMVSLFKMAVVVAKVMQQPDCSALGTVSICFSCAFIICYDWTSSFSTLRIFQEDTGACSGIFFLFCEINMT